mmetsp:Transcript_21466/g.20635  ORF Transcript_21466/g.20635 Transcript_21466/m.20635 type:complete len:155 (+) Transcript_21466:755-1219(+)|eukprot:CAMPEP_0170544868 /NCGR_PEP_ID=MMETSP0211-20121228/3469_1 /TAXON_ID=311385 /ORGANISM="Pseudokeronopsis sp., Strain OXSARD2" /LENGTH=154 /DNA_ID=CAMNT_0010848623 /DNA_START=697 /DNA_END=1161 /DNA_ORIENTATION=-
MDGQNAADILTDPGLILPLNSEKKIKDYAKGMLLEDYEKVEELYPDIEERISKVKGLMSDLFTHKRKKGKKFKKRKSSLGDDKEKKKVRFNVSNTIYEETRAINEESDSILDPLSVYSYNSPPGEFNDDIVVSSTHSSMHMPSNMRRHSGTLLT